MAIKKENVNLTYDALWFKTFMDSGELTFYNREIFISPGMAGRLDIFMQLLGNVGGYARTTNFDKDLDVVVVSDYLMNKFKSGEKDEFFQMLEDLINASATPYRKLKFTTESIVLESLNTRARGQLRQNKKDLKDKNTTPQMIEAINLGIERDELMLGMIKKYKESTKEPQQQNLF